MEGRPWIVMGMTIALIVILSAILIYSFIYVIQKGYSRKWDDE